MNFASDILIILLVILLNALFVLSEMSVASSRKARLQQHINEGNKGAKTALSLIQNPNLFLATVQIGITLVGVFVGAIGAATLSEPIAGLLARMRLCVPMITRHSARIMRKLATSIARKVTIGARATARARCTPTKMP